MHVYVASLALLLKRPQVVHPSGRLLPESGPLIPVIDQIMDVIELHHQRI